MTAPGNEPGKNIDAIKNRKSFPRACAPRNDFRIYKKVEPFVLFTVYFPLIMLIASAAIINSSSVGTTITFTEESSVLMTASSP